ncbi:hypothetical protein C7212DRAFT_349856 [Tuber magnatum]|uniref:Uncharacterized protein n=1 Tax=Tuber magnatum TaxID=42249 RepID=A0A317T182_9PEZI|nr:hypothetical protein C7212DRAFT_349856 [Tuber magnatum]
MTGVNMEQIGQIEKLTAQDKARTTGEEDGEIKPKPMEALQELRPQSTRMLRNLSLGINLANAPLDDLGPPLIDLVPRRASSAVAQLIGLDTLTLTLSVASQLSFLSDTPHMVRQSSVAVNQKLRMTKEACADWKSELERVERSRRLMEDGDRDAKCQNRPAANVCSEVTGEFEDMCRGNEGTLRAQAVLA